MQELPKDIDPDLVIEIDRLLEDARGFIPIRVHEVAAKARQKVTTGLSNLSIEKLIVQMATARHLAMAFDLPGTENVVHIPVHRPRS